MPSHSPEKQGPSIKFLRMIPNKNFKLSKIKMPILYGNAPMPVVTDRLTMFNFFITRCGPCQEEFPVLLKAQHILQNKLRIIPVNVGEDQKIVAKYFEEVEWDGPVILDGQRRLAKKFGVFAYPTTYLINPDGHICFFIEEGLICQCFIGGRRWNDKNMISFLQMVAREMSRVR